MSVLKYFKNIPRSPPIGRQALSVIFSSSNLQRGPWKKRGHVAPPRATGGPAAPPSGDRWARPTGAAGGPVAPLWATGPPPRATAPYISYNPPSLLI